MDWVQFISVIGAAFVGSWFGTIWRERAFKRERAGQIVAAVSSFLAQARRCEDFAQGTAPHTRYERQHGHLHPDEATYTPDALLTVRLEMWNIGEQARLLLDEDIPAEKKLDHAIECLMHGIGERASYAALGGCTHRIGEHEFDVEPGINKVQSATRTVRQKLQSNFLGWLR